MNQSNDSNIETLLPPGVGMSQAVYEGRFYEIRPVTYWRDGRPCFVHVALSPNFIDTYLVDNHPEHIDTIMMSLIDDANIEELDWRGNSQLSVNVGCPAPEGGQQSVEVVMTTHIELGIKHWLLLMTPEECSSLLN